MFVHSTYIYTPGRTAAQYQQKNTFLSIFTIKILLEAQAFIRIITFDRDGSGHLLEAVTYIRVTRNSNEIPMLNSNNTVGYLTQVNEGNSISFIYTIGFYCYFGIHSVFSLLFT